MGYGILKARMYLHIPPFKSVLLTYLVSCPGCMYTCIIIDQSHEDMLFHEGGVCDTLGIQVFLRFSGESVSLCEIRST